LPIGAAYNQLISVANNEVLMIAGARNTNYSPSFSYAPATSHIYRVATNTWVESPMALDGRIGYAAAKWSNEKVIVTGGTGQNEVELFTAAVSTGTNALQNKLFVQVYPTPSMGLFAVEVDFGTKDVAFQISDLQGKSVSVSQTYDGRLWQFDMSNQPKGMYRIAVLKEGKPVSIQPILLH